MRTLLLDWFHWCFVPEVKEYFARRDCFLKFFWYWAMPWLQNPMSSTLKVSKWSVVSKHMVSNSGCRSGDHEDPEGSSHTGPYGKHSPWSGGEPQQNIKKVCKDYSIEDATVIIENAAKAIKSETINRCWRKLCPDVVHDFTACTTESVTEIMKEIMDMV